MQKEQILNFVVIHVEIDITENTKVISKNANIAVKVSRITREESIALLNVPQTKRKKKN